MKEDSTMEDPEIQGITKISVTGFKSLSSTCEIPVRRLTVLAGANCSGKSSIMQPMLMMKQTLESPYDPGPLLLNGPNVRFTSAGQFFSNMGGNEYAKEMVVAIETDGSYYIKSIFSKGTSGPQLAKMEYGGDGKLFEFKNGMIVDSASYVIPAQLKELAEAFSKERKTTLSWQVQRDRCFFALALTENIEKTVRTVLSAAPLSPSFELQARLRDIIHVPGLRGNPERTYPVTAIGGEFPGRFQDYVASIINMWQSEDNKRLQQLFNDLQVLGLTWKIEAHPLDDVQVELRVGRLVTARRGGAQDLVSIADVGFGVSQTIPVLVALLAARKNQLVYIEEPEIHLHPNAQAALAEIFLRAASRGVRVVVETHSSLFLRKLQALVAERPEYRRLVALHWFDRNKDGYTKVTSAELDQTGAFGEWPSDFDEVSLRVEKEYINAGVRK
ncbi:MAG TPA: AAA family ATPase [Candidatus Acidoferrales bacterium]|nr:AAA family ATPase [Candidatus Acidoferrales bacterium]